MFRPTGKVDESSLDGALRNTGRKASSRASRRGARESRALGGEGCGRHSGLRPPRGEAAFSAEARDPSACSHGANRPASYPYKSLTASWAFCCAENPAITCTTVLGVVATAFSCARMACTSCAGPGDLERARWQLRFVQEVPNVDLRGKPRGARRPRGNPSEPPGGHGARRPSWPATIPRAKRGGSCPLVAGGVELSLWIPVLSGRRETKHSSAK